MTVLYPEQWYLKEFLKAYSPNKEEMNELHSLKNLLQPPVVRAGVALCILISLVAGPLLGNGKLTVFLVTKLSLT